MFTGLVQDVGTVRHLQAGAVTDVWLNASFDLTDVVLGESIACDGACLTVVEKDASGFRVQAAPETLRRTTLGGWTVGSRVNLERAMRLSDRLGGHLVSGHVDATAQVLATAQDGGALVLQLELPRALGPLFIEKGSVTVDGVSLTVNTVGPDRFGVMLIPETQERTTLASKQVGERVNLEADLIGKYVARLYAAHSASPSR